VSAKKIITEKKCCLSLLTGLSMVDATYDLKGVVLRESFPQYISRLYGKLSTLHSIHIICISKFHWFSFHKLLSAVKASMRNHWFIYT